MLFGFLYVLNCRCGVLRGVVCLCCVGGFWGVVGVSFVARAAAEAHKAPSPHSTPLHVASRTARGSAQVVYSCVVSESVCTRLN